MIENRAHPRFATSLSCEITHGGLRVNGWTRDLSRGGISLETERPMEISSVVDLALSLHFGPSAASEALRIKGVVVWCTPIGGRYQIGAKFEMVPKETTTFLDVFLKLLDGGCDPLDDASDE